MCSRAKASSHVSIAILSAGQRWQQALLLECPVVHVRQMACDVLFAALETVALQERHRGVYQAARSRSPVEQPIESNRAAPPSTVISYLDILLPLILRATKYWRNFNEFFALIRRFAELGPFEVQLLLDNHLVAELFAFYLQKESPHLLKLLPEVQQIEYMSSNARLGADDVDPNADEIVHLLGILLRHCQPPVVDRRADQAQQNPELAGAPPGIANPGLARPHKMSPYSLARAQLGLPPADAHRVAKRSAFLLDKFYRQNQNPLQLQFLVCHLCWHNVAWSDLIIHDVLLYGVDDLYEQYFSPYFQSLKALLAMDDFPTSRIRIESTMTKFMHMIQANQQYEGATKACVTLVLELARDVPGVASYFAHHRSYLDWLNEYAIANQLSA